MPVPGDTLTKRLSILDASGTGIPGATFTLDAIGPDNTPRTPGPVLDLGSGIYEFSLPTTVADPQGMYYLRAVSDTVPPQVREIEWLVKPLGTPDRWRPGDTIMDYITVIDPEANPIIGDSFTVTAIGPTGNSIPIAAPAEVGNGIYRVAITTSRFDPPGTYYVSLRSQSLPSQVYEIEFVTGQPTNLIGGMNLRTLRRRVMAHFGDLISCTATQDGTTSTFIDEDSLVGEPGRYAGREVLFVTGMNAGQKRYVAGSSRDSSGIALARPLPYPTLAGDEADITNAYGIGITFQAVDNAINYAIDIARDRAHVPVNYRIEDWDGASAIPIPPEAVGINDVYGIDKDGRQHIIRRGSNRSNGWMLDRPTRTILINGYAAQQARGYAIMVNARVLPNLLTDDDDVTMIPAQWLIATATAHLCLDTALSRQASGDWGSKGMLYRQESERLVSTLTPNIGSNYQEVN